MRFYIAAKYFRLLVAIWNEIAQLIDSDLRNFKEKNVNLFVECAILNTKDVILYRLFWLKIINFKIYVGILYIAQTYE